MKKKILIIVSIIVAILIVVGVIHLAITYTKPIKTIKFYERQTHQYFDSRNYSNGQYIIESDKEFKVFKKRYDDPIKEKMNFDKNVLFIKTEPANSSSITKKLKRVGTKDNKLIFTIKTKTPKNVTDDIAFWYYVAVISKDEIQGLDLTDWSKPSRVKE